MVWLCLQILDEATIIICKSKELLYITCLGNPDEGLQAIRKGFMKDQASMFFVYKNNYYYVFILTGEKLLLWLTRKMAHHQFTIPTARF